MPIIDLQRRMVRRGKIALGEQRISQRGKTYPAALSTIRVKSSDRAVVEAVAEIYGGTVEEWESPAGPGWDVTTERSDIPVLLPPFAAVSQWYEQWTAGGIANRCDGVDDVVSGGACTCDPENRACLPTTRLDVILPEVRVLGTFLVEAHGYNAAAELPGTIDLLRLAGGDQLVPARMRVGARMVKRPGPDGKPVTQRFVVPEFGSDVSIGELLGTRALHAPERPSIEAPRGEVPDDSASPASPAIPAESRPKPPSIEEQVADADTLRAAKSKVPLKRPGLPLRPAGLAHDRGPSASPNGRPVESTGGGGDPGRADGPVDPSPPVDAHASNLGPSHRRLMAITDAAFPDLRGRDLDDMRYACTAAVTGGERTSSADLTATERDRVSDLIGRYVEGVASIEAIGLDRWEISVEVPKGRRIADVARMGDTWDVQTRTVES